MPIATVATPTDVYDAFRLKPLTRDRFVSAPALPFDGRVFGGELVAQAAMAAMMVEEQGRALHSLHAYFLQPGDAAGAIEYRVSALFDGRSFATRQVTAMQEGRDLLVLSASFHRVEDGPEHQRVAPIDGDPERALRALQDWRESQVAAGLPDPARRFDVRPIMIVPVDPERAYGADRGPARAAAWIRCRTPSPADPILQRALIAYASDMMLLRTSMLPHGIRPGMPGVQSASLDHALWIHCTPDLNQWHLFETDSSWSRNARAMTHGRLSDRAGVLVAEVAQESLVRRR